MAQGVAMYIDPDENSFMWFFYKLGHWKTRHFNAVYTVYWFAFGLRLGPNKHD